MYRVAPLHSDFVAAGHQPYVFNAAAAGLCSEEEFTTMAYVVLTRRQGLLLVYPWTHCRAKFWQVGQQI